jgi:hypothetical protein
MLDTCYVKAGQLPAKAGHMAVNAGQISRRESYNLLIIKSYFELLTALNF